MTGHALTCRVHQSPTVISHNYHHGAARHGYDGTHHALFSLEYLHAHRAILYAYGATVDISTFLSPARLVRVLIFTTIAHRSVAQPQGTFATIWVCAH
jgi:hypothetical protein